jgi:transposase
VASEVARAAGIHVSQLFRWRQRLCAVDRSAPTFSPVAVMLPPGAGSAVPRATDSMEIEFGNGMRLRITWPGSTAQSLLPR